MRLGVHLVSFETRGPGAAAEEAGIDKLSLAVLRGRAAQSAEYLSAGLVTTTPSGRSNLGHLLLAQRGS